MMLLADRGELTARELAEHLGITVRGARKILSRLAEAGLAERDGNVWRPAGALRALAEARRRRTELALLGLFIASAISVFLSLLLWNPAPACILAAFLTVITGYLIVTR